jgi:FixJ family two-component response regulator
MVAATTGCYSSVVTPPASPEPLVVVVEDDPASRKSLGRVLRAGGFDAAMFASAEEFLSATKGLSPIALLLDLQLPGLSGLDPQRRLRSEGSTLPIVVITAHDDSRVREDVERLGCLAYLAKPCNSATILALLRPLVATPTQAG